MTPPSLKVRRDALVAGVLAGRLPPGAFPALYSDAADTFLSSLLAGATNGRTKGLALVATGGYGRRELCPGSDLDVVLVHARRRDLASVADLVWYPVWDSGVRLDHSVRSVKEALGVAAEDLRTLLGLVDARVVAGDEGVAAPLLEQVAELWRAHSRRFLPELSTATRSRHARFGEAPFLLEPDLKESAGGLRDLQTLCLASRALPHMSSSLLPPAIDSARSLILAARVALHGRTGTRSDRLLLQEQDGVAELLAFPGADALMAAVCEAARETMWASAEGWRRIASVLNGPTGRAGGRDVPLAADIVLRDGEVAFSQEAEPATEPALLVRLAAAAAAEGVPIAAPALDRLERKWCAPKDVWPAELRDGFISLLQYGPAATGVLELLDQRHLLERLLPEWSHVRHLPQRNAYHRFTVDRHLLETAARAASLVRSVARPDLLLVAAFLHDIGKGLPGDHSRVGRDLARTAAVRMGFVPEDITVVERLVEHHLLLADLATRRDLDDPATIELVTSRVGDRMTLELLAALTEADSIATGPTAWSQWKAELVGVLVARADALLRGEAPSAPSASAVVTDEHRRLMAAGRLAVEVSGERVTVVAPDRPGLFSLVAGTLALHRLDIRRAFASSDTLGMAIELFDVGQDVARPVDADSLRDDLAEAIAGRLLLEARLASLEEAYARGRRPTAPEPPEVRVLIDDRASSHATVVEVRAPDSHGLLHRLTACLASASLDVVSAQIQTLGHEVVDSFYVRTFGGGRPERPGIEAIVPRLEEAARSGRVLFQAPEGGISRT